jgi:transcriptional regulator of acetoin/glycerol metabolism
MSLSHMPSELDLTPDADALAAMQRAREAFFHDPGILSVPGLRAEIAHSWRRSLASGVDYTTMELPDVRVDGRAERLSRAAAPVMARLGEQLDGSSAWAMLLDRGCTQLGSVVGDAAACAVSVDRGARPGAVFNEARVGTNGAGTAAERLEPFVVVGPEHFRESERRIVSVGAPVRDALNRVAGIVSLNCRIESSNGILVSFARDVAWAIGHRLIEEAQGVERELFARFARHARRPSQAVLAVGDDVLIANTAARQLTMHGVNVETIAQQVLDSAHANDQLEFEFEVGREGERVRIRASRVEFDDGRVGALANLSRVAGSARRRQTRSPEGADAREVDMLRRARAAGSPAIVVGERGSGKAALAQSARVGTGAVFDARSAVADSAAWLGALREASTAAADVLLRHADELPAELRADVAAIIDTASAWFVATGGSAVADAPSVVDDKLAVVVHRSPLRDRKEEFARIVEATLTEARVGGRPVRCLPDAMAVLSRQRWPGNISQLRRVLLSAAMSSSTGEIGLAEIPATALVDAHARELTRLERLERELVLTSLREAAWNREEAAKALGVSRATMYRKLRQYDISVPSSRS